MLSRKVLLYEFRRPQAAKSSDAFVECRAGRLGLEHVLRRKMTVERPMRQASNSGDVASLQPLPSQSDRLVPLMLDVTKSDQITHAAGVVSDITLLINNAGTATCSSALPTKDGPGIPFQFG
jgi:hypothetical protein